MELGLKIENLNKIYKKIKVDSCDDVLYNCYFTKDLYDLDLELLDTSLILVDFDVTDKIISPHLKFLNKKCKRVYKYLLKPKEINKKYIKNNFKEICCLSKLHGKVIQFISVNQVEHDKEETYQKLLNLDSENMTENEYLQKCKELKDQYINIANNCSFNKDVQYIRYLPNESLILLGYKLITFSH